MLSDEVKLWLGLTKWGAIQALLVDVVVMGLALLSRDIPFIYDIRTLKGLLFIDITLTACWSGFGMALWALPHAHQIETNGC